MIPSCREMDPLIQLFVDGEINESERQILQEHIKTCASCHAHLVEMIELVQNLEEVGYKERVRQQRILLLPMKWVMIYAGIALFILVSPVHTITNTHELQVADQSDLQQEIERLNMMVLATQSEKLHIPKNDYIQVVQPKQMNSSIMTHTALIYPSAMPLMQNGQQPWLNKIHQFVFVKVPDLDTYLTLLDTVGVPHEKSELKGQKLDFPTSIIIKTGEQPHIETFQFPENEKGVMMWFDKLATQSTIQ